MRQSDQFGARYAAPRPWHIEHITRKRHALIKSADGSIVAVCHVTNAAMIVEAVDAHDDLHSPTAGRAGEAETAEATDAASVHGGGER